MGKGISCSFHFLLLYFCYSFIIILIYLPDIHWLFPRFFFIFDYYPPIQERLRWIIGRAALVSPEARLAQQEQRLDELEQRLSRALRQILADRRSALGD